jgi:hypothetical protein
MVMEVRLHGMQEEIRVGDTVDTHLGVGVVTRIAGPVRERDQAMLEIEMGRKWLNVDQVRAIIRHKETHPSRQEPEPHWDEHD